MNAPAGDLAPSLRDLHFPEPETPLHEHCDEVTWEQWMDELQPFLDYHLRHHDSPQDRLSTKLPQRFVLVD